MIIRYGGGNSGIKEYLEVGRKADRHFSRDELDKRIPLEGDLNFTDSVIDSMPNRGQDRYLHISLSFNEPGVTEEKMAEVFQQYKAELFAAYGEDEFDVYAEIHWPKIKEAYNHQTEKMEPRYPHIHVVVPKKNLLTGGFLNPIGIHERSVKYLDAIQEKLNRDNGLSSPRDSPRVGTNHYESALGKYKDKEFKSKNGLLKKLIHEQVIDRDIRTVEDFKSLVSEHGEVKVRNAGKQNEYLAVRPPGDEKFTNLKGNIFTADYIESRALILPPISDAQVNRRVDTWRTIQSREIKYISNASKAVKDKYRAMSLGERRDFLSQRESDYEQRFRSEAGAGVRRADAARDKLSGLREGDYQSGYPELATRHETQRARDMHELRAGDVDYFDSERLPANRLFLQGDENDDISERIKPNGNAGLRHNLYAGSPAGRIGLYTNPRSSVVSALIVTERDEAEQSRAASLARFAQIRKELDPEHLLSYCQINYGVDPARHKVTRAKDGSARINVGKYNYNVSDFLTKHIGLDWSEASGILVDLHERQKAGLVQRPKSKDEHINDWRTFRDHVYPVNVKTFDELKNQIKISYSLGVKAINSEYWARRKSITLDQSLTRQDKHYFRSIVILEKLQKIEELQRRVGEQNRLNSKVKYPYSTLFYNYATKNEEATMKVLDQLKKQFVKDDAEREAENSIGSPVLVTPSALPTGAEAARRAKLVASMQHKEREAAELKIKLSDLRPQPLATGGVAFCVKDNGKQVFVNHPDRLELNRVTEPDEVGVALIYATERFGSPLDIKGTEEFKSQLIEVAAERDMDVTFTDEAMNQALNEKRVELGLEPLQGNTIEVADLEIDKALPINEAVDRALLQSKVDELAQLPVSNAADHEINLAVVADAATRHEEIASGLASDERIAELAQQDLEGLSQLEGRAEQVDMAVAIGAVMANQQYREYMAEHAPEEFNLTLDAARVVHQQKSMEAAVEAQAAVSPDEVTTEQQAGRAEGLVDAVKYYKLLDPRYDAEYVRENAGEMIDIAEEAGASRFQAVMASGEVVQVSKDNAGEWQRADGLQLPDEVRGVQDARLLAAATDPERAAERLAVAADRWQSDEYREAFIKEAKPELAPLVRQLDGTDKRLRFEFEGKPVTIDLERYTVRQPQADADMGQRQARLVAMAATAEIAAGHMADAASRWDSDEYRTAFIQEAEKMELSGEAKTEIAPLVRQLDGTDKDLSSLSINFVHEGKPVTIDLDRFQPDRNGKTFDADESSVDSVVRKAAVIEAMDRHQEIRDGNMEPEKVRAVAAQDLEAYGVVAGYPEQAELAKSISQMQDIPEYRNYMAENAPSSFAIGLTPGAPSQPEISVPVKGSDDMEM